MPDYELCVIPPIESLNDPQWAWAYQGLYLLDARVNAAMYGSADRAKKPERFAAEHRNQNQAIRLLAAAVTKRGDPESVVGSAWVELPIDANLSLSYGGVFIDMEHVSTVGDTLLSCVERFCQDHGRTTLAAFADFGPDDLTGMIPAESGGEVPSDAPMVDLWLKHGYAPAEAERQSILTLPLDPTLAEALLAEAMTDTAGYRLHTWIGPVPEQWRPGYAVLRARFSTLEPDAGLMLENEVWDEQRVIREEKQHEESGRVPIVTAIEHRDSRELVGYTELAVYGQEQTVSHQDVTVVLPEHRGHRLGQWMKMTNLKELRRVHPQIQRVYTWNAEGNASMLTINERMGFRPNGGAAMMCKTLGPPPGVVP